MSHALVQHVDQIEPDPHLKFAHLVDRTLTSRQSLDDIAMQIKSAAALYVGECVARAMRELGPNGPRFVERDNPLVKPPLTVVAPSEPTTEFAPMQPESEPSDPPTARLEAVTDDPAPTEPLAKTEAQDGEPEPAKAGK